MTPWVGFDLDGTLAYHNSGDSIDIIGEPIPIMVARVMVYLNQNVEVKIVTARVCSEQDPIFRFTQKSLVEAWCVKHFGKRLIVTSEKDFAMIYLYDDRCKQVILNTGQLVEELISLDDYHLIRD